MLTKEEFLMLIDNHVEYLETTEGDEVECISIENLISILKQNNIIYEK